MGLRIALSSRFPFFLFFIISVFPFLVLLSVSILLSSRCLNLYCCSCLSFCFRPLIVISSSSKSRFLPHSLPPSFLLCISFYSHCRLHFLFVLHLLPYLKFSNCPAPSYSPFLSLANHLTLFFSIFPLSLTSPYTFLSPGIPSSPLFSPLPMPLPRATISSLFYLVLPLSPLRLLPLPSSFPRLSFFGFPFSSL